MKTKTVMCFVPGCRTAVERGAVACDDHARPFAAAVKALREYRDTMRACLERLRKRTA